MPLYYRMTFWFGVLLAIAAFCAALLPYHVQSSNYVYYFRSLSAFMLVAGIGFLSLTGRFHRDIDRGGSAFSLGFICAALGIAGLFDKVMTNSRPIRVGECLLAMTMFAVCVLILYLAGAEKRHRPWKRLRA